MSALREPAKHRRSCGGYLPGSKLDGEAGSFIQRSFDFSSIFMVPRTVTGRETHTDLFISLFQNDFQVDRFSNIIASGGRVGALVRWGAG